MTREDLRDARMAEARRLTIAEGEENLNPLCVVAFANHLCDLIEQDWRPEPEVDAVTLAARERMKSNVSWRRNVIDEGKFDRHPFADAFRAGHADGQATCADVRRMDWLEGQSVDVLPMKRGKIEHPFYCTDSLRTKIDRAMESGE